MRNKRLEMLYRTLIKEHANDPKNKRTLEQPSGEMQLFNPSCGDLVIVQYQVANNIIKDIAFEGQGCAISMASASMLTELMLGKTVEEAKTLIQTFYELVKGNESMDTEPLKDAVYLQGVSQFPTRIRCATLSWHALEQGLIEAEEGTKQRKKDYDA